MINCEHNWIANSGNGGAPVFKMMGGTAKMHVKCAKCNARTWFTQAQWGKVR